MNILLKTSAKVEELNSSFSTIFIAVDFNMKKPFYYKTETYLNYSNKKCYISKLAK